MGIEVLASGSSGNLIRLTDGKTTLLLEAGISYNRLRKAVGNRLSNISACLVTHEHGDHSKAVSKLCPDVSVVATQGTLQALKVPAYFGCPVEYDSPVRIKSFEITAFRVKHDAVQPCGFHLRSTHINESVVYVPDTAYSPYVFSNTKYLITELNYDIDTLKKNYDSGLLHEKLYSRIQKTHHSLKNCLEFIKACNYEVIYIVHLSRSNLNYLKAISEIKKIHNGDLYVAGKLV